MSLLIELAFSLAASVNDWTRCRIESLVLAGLVGALMVRLPGCCCCCCWNSSRMSAASDAGVAACERDGLDAYCRCWARCCDCEPADGCCWSGGAIDGSASSASADRSPEENLHGNNSVLNNNNNIELETFKRDFPFTIPAQPPQNEETVCVFDRFVVIHSLSSIIPTVLLFFPFISSHSLHIKIIASYKHSFHPTAINSTGFLI